MLKALYSSLQKCVLQLACYAVPVEKWYYSQQEVFIFSFTAFNAPTSGICSSRCLVDCLSNSPLSLQLTGCVVDYLSNSPLSLHKMVMVSLKSENQRRETKRTLLLEKKMIITRNNIRDVGRLAEPTSRADVLYSAGFLLPLYTPLFCTLTLLHPQD